MKITEHMEKNKGDTLFSFEVVPPQKGKSIQDLYNNIEPLMAFNPPFIDVTTSREESIYIKRDKGLLEKRIIRMRPGTVGICAAIMHKYRVDTVPHILCGGYTREETEYVLVDCQYLGIDNVMALRGDSMKEEAYFSPTDGGNAFACDLVEQISDLNQGRYLHDSAVVEESADFCIGVAGYPEKHVEAPSLATDLKRLKQKVDAGADYVVTQMFFDNQKYFDFAEQAKAIGIDVPIIPGLKPITVKRHLQLLPQVFNIDLPQELIDAVEACQNDRSVRQVGIEFCIAQSRQLKATGVPVLHYYSMGKSDNIVAIAKAVF